MNILYLSFISQIGVPVSPTFFTCENNTTDMNRYPVRLT